MTFPSRPTPALPCPQCLYRSRDKDSKATGAHRIGNKRSTCTTCNNFSQNVMRLTRKRLKERFEKEYEEIRVRVELDLYPQIVEDWNEALTTYLEKEIAE